MSFLIKILLDFLSISTTISNQKFPIKIAHFLTIFSYVFHSFFTDFFLPKQPIFNQLFPTFFIHFYSIISYPKTPQFLRFRFFANQLFPMQFYPIFSLILLITSSLKNRSGIGRLDLNASRKLRATFIFCSISLLSTK